MNILYRVRCMWDKEISNYGEKMGGAIVTSVTLVRFYVITV
jgi:hypothetical protein